MDICLIVTIQLAPRVLFLLGMVWTARYLLIFMVCKNGFVTRYSANKKHLTEFVYTSSVRWWLSENVLQQKFVLLFARNKASAVESVGVIYIRADFTSIIKCLFGVAEAMIQTTSGHYVFLAIPERPVARTERSRLEPSVWQSSNNKHWVSNQHGFTKTSMPNPLARVTESNLWKQILFNMRLPS